MTRRDELLTVLVAWITEQDTKGSLPSERRCHLICKAAGYPLAWSTFKQHWGKLVNEGKIQVHYSGAIYIPDSVWLYKGEFTL